MNKRPSTTGTQQSWTSFRLATATVIKTRGKYVSEDAEQFIVDTF